MSGRLKDNYRMVFFVSELSRDPSSRKQRFERAYPGLNADGSGDHLIWPVLSVGGLVVRIFSKWSAGCEPVSRVGKRRPESNDLLAFIVQLSASDVLGFCCSPAESVGVLL